MYSSEGCVLAHLSKIATLLDFSQEVREDGQARGIFGRAIGNASLVVLGLGSGPQDDRRLHRAAGQTRSLGVVISGSKFENQSCG
jgi:hypothetical protein